MGRTELAAERKQQILEAAVGCFARKGFHAATMPEICAAAELSPGTVYRYFRSKEELIEALVEADRAESLALIEAMARTPHLAHAIALAVDAALEAMDDPEAAAIYLEVGAEAARNPRIATIVRRHDESINNALAALLTRSQERGEVSPHLEPRLMAEMINALIDGVISRKALFPETDLQPYAASLKQTMFSMLRSDPPTQPDTAH